MIRDRRVQVSLVVCVRRVVAMFYDAGLQSGDILLNSDKPHILLRRAVLSITLCRVSELVQCRIQSVSIYNNQQ
jgi:hypothetical protein